MITLGLLISSATAVDDVYFLSLNDTLSPLTADLMPMKSNNIIYVPSGMFDRNVTGIDLGVYFGQDKAAGTATLYSKDKTLIFDINASYAYDFPEGKNYAFRAIIRNGRTYLPAYQVCQFFGLDYSALGTDYGPLIRIKRGTLNQDYWLNDMVFISSASLQMSRSLNEYLQNQMSASPSVSIVPSIPGSQPVDGNKSGIRVYLAMKVDGGRSLSDLLDILDGQSVSVLFFFRPSQLSEYDNEIRRLTGSGHLIGLLIEGEGEQTPQEQIARGNLLLEQIIMQRTYTLLVDGTDNQRTQLSEQGYLCWLENVDGRTYNRSSITLVTHIMNEVDAKQSFARVILEDSINPTALSKLLRQLATAQYDVHPALETTF